MKPRLYPLLVLIGTVTGGVVAWLNVGTADKAAADLASIERSQAQLANALQATTARLAQARESAAKLRAQLQTTSSGRLASTTGTATPPQSKPAGASRIIEDNPMLQNLQAAARYAQLVITYGPLYRLLGLSPVQIKKFEENLVLREQQQADLFATITNQGLPLNDDPVFQTLMERVNKEYQAAQYNVLGEAGAKKLEDYDRLAYVRETVSGMAGAAAMAGTPLDTQQAELLTRTLAQASRNYPKSDALNPSTIDWRVVHDQAKAFLTSSQLTFIETTEAQGPRGSGGRFLPVLNGAIDAAAHAESAAASNQPR